MSLRALFDGIGRRSVAPAAVHAFCVTIDGQMLPVRIKTHARSTRLRLRYDAALQELRLVMPPGTRLPAARRWVEAQQEWIRRQRLVAPARQMVGPGTIVPWGDTDGLVIDWNIIHPRQPRLCEDQNGVVPLTLGGPESAVPARVQRWFVEVARARFTAATQEYAVRAGGRCIAVSVADTRSRWGSCTAAGHIRYNWRLLLAPSLVQNAIVAHEVAHLIHMHHGPAFHALVETLAPGSRGASREWLRRHGAGLHRWRFDSRPA